MLTPCGPAACSFLPLSPLTPVPSTGPSLLPVSSLPSILLKGTPENLIVFPGGACPAPGRRPFRVALAHRGLVLQRHVRQAWTGHLGSAWRQSASWVSAHSVHSQLLLPSSRDRGWPARAHWAPCQPRRSVQWARSAQPDVAGPGPQQLDLMVFCLPTPYHILAPSSCFSFQTPSLFLPEVRKRQLFSESALLNWTSLDSTGLCVYWALGVMGEGVIPRTKQCHF